jgi:predicted esterase
MMLHFLVSLLPNAGKLATCVLPIVAAVACGDAANREVRPCGPFGSPPARLIGAAKPDCGIGELLGPWKDSDGADRYACLYKPTSATSGNKLPLLVYLHPSLFSANIITRTNLLDFQESYLLSGDSNRPGFLLLAPQGRRTTHDYPHPDRSGMGWDNWYRQLNPAGDVTRGDTIYRENVDAATIDHFIAQEIATGEVENNRIYVTGWSNGAAMGFLYSLNRPNVAALAVYSGPDPFGAFNDQCPQKPIAHVPANDTELQIFNSRVPAMHIHNACDVEGICPNAERMTAELRAAGVNVCNVIIDSSGRRVTTCAGFCGLDPNAGLSLLRNPLGYCLGLYHHARWPQGWDRYMLDFLRRNSLNAPAGASRR